MGDKRTGIGVVLFVRHNGNTTLPVNPSYSFHTTDAARGVTDHKVFIFFGGHPFISSDFCILDSGFRILKFFFYNIQRIIGAHLYTGWSFPPRAKITFGCFPGPSYIRPDGAFGTRQNTGPASDALVTVLDDLSSLLVLVYGSRYARISAIRLRTVAALECEGDRTVLLYCYPGGRCHLFLESLDDVHGPGVLHLTVDLTEVATDTDLFN